MKIDMLDEKKESSPVHDVKTFLPIHGDSLVFHCSLSAHTLIEFLRSTYKQTRFSAAISLFINKLTFDQKHYLHLAFFQLQ